MKSLIIVLLTLNLWAQEGVENLQHLLSPSKPVKTNDITDILLNSLDILRLTHKETLIHPESKVLKDKKQSDYIIDWENNGTLEVYEGKYPKSNYWFTTKIYRSSTKKVIRIEEAIRTGDDKDADKSVLASITNFSGLELKDRTICEGEIKRDIINNKFKRFLASEDQHKEVPQVILNCKTITENLCQEYERITKLNERFDKNGQKYWEKFFTKDDHKAWINKITKSYNYQTKQRNNFIDLKMDLKPGGKYANIYWPKKLTHHQYNGINKSEALNDENYESLKDVCANHTAFIAPNQDYIRAPKKTPKSAPSSISNGLAQSN